MHKDIIFQRMMIVYVKYYERWTMFDEITALQIWHMLFSETLYVFAVYAVSELHDISADDCHHLVRCHDIKWYADSIRQRWRHVLALLKYDGVVFVLEKKYQFIMNTTVCFFPLCGCILRTIEDNTNRQSYQITLLFIILNGLHFLSESNILENATCVN